MRTPLPLLCLVALFSVGCSRRAPETPAVVLDTPEPRAAGPVIQVTASYPGANARTVADTVATPLEQQINGVEGLETLESESRHDGRYTATVRFAPGTNPEIAQVMVQNRVNLTDPALPEEVRRVGITIRKGNPDRFPQLWVTVASPDSTHDALFLQNYTTLRVKDELARVPGVADVKAVGGSAFAMRIWIDPEKLAARDLTVAEVTAAIERQNAQISAGQIGQIPFPAGHRFQFTVTTLGRLTDPKEFERIVVRTTARGKVVYLRDVAELEVGQRIASAFARLNGKPAALLAIRTNGEKLTADGVRKVIAELGNTAPRGLTVQVTELSDGSFTVVELRLPDAASVQRTEVVVARAEMLIRGMAGSPECLAFGEREPNVAQVLVRLKDTTPADIRKALADVKEAAIRVSELSDGVPFPVRLALVDAGNHGDEKLRAWAEAVTKRFTDGLALDADVSPGRGIPQISVELDRTKIQALGVSLTDVLPALRAAVGDLYVNDFNQFGRTAQIRVHPDGKSRATLDDIKRLRVRSDKGEFVSLGAVLTLREETAAPTVLRVGLYPALKITAALPPGKTLAEVAATCVKIAEAEKPVGGFKVIDLTVGK